MRLLFFLAMNGILGVAAGLVVCFLADNGLKAFGPASPERFVAVAALKSAKLAERERPLGRDSIFPVIRMRVAGIVTGPCRANLPPSAHDDRTVVVEGITFFAATIREYRVSCGGRSAAEVR